MLPKTNRLNLRESFKWVAGGKHTRTTSFKLVYRLGENTLPRVGITAPSAVFRKSTLRNRARRLASSAVERLYLRLRNNLNLVIIPQRPVLEKTISSLEEELNGIKDLFRLN